MNRTNTVVLPYLGGTLTIGRGPIVVAAGPCSIESADHMAISGARARSSGATLYRGGIFKMRTSPTSFQGLGYPALDFIASAKQKMGLPFISEITDPRQIEAMLSVVDIFQVGSRNMYNYELLKELGRGQTPVLLKRAMSATIDEWIKAADYVVQGGNSSVILCERGIRTFETATRNTLDLNAVAYVKAHTNFPIFADPSHGTGRADLVAPMARAAVAAGADGLLIEAHDHPSCALSDADQAIGFDELAELVKSLEPVARAIGREIQT